MLIIHYLMQAEGLSLIDQIHLRCFGPIEDLKWSNLGPINCIIGKNGAGKTIILKALYAALRTLETYKRGDEQRSAAEILADKLYWTFQPDKIGDLVMKGEQHSLHYSMTQADKAFQYTFGKDTAKQIATLENHIEPRAHHSVFLPAKEVLSLHHLILRSREEDRSFGFDDTYLDLARALRHQKNKPGGRNYAPFAEARKNLEHILDDKVELDQSTNRWVFKKGNQKFSIGLTAEGVKKIAIFDTLLSNRYLTPESVLMIDEPESALHPDAIINLLDMISMLAQAGIQCFLATQSYFVIKKLYLIAQEKKMSIPIAANEEDGWMLSDLSQDMPSNAIIQKSVDLYKQEVDLVI